MKVEVAAPGSPSLISLMVFLISLMVSADVKQHFKKLRSCMKVEVAVLGSLTLIVLTVSVDVKQH